MNSSHISDRVSRLRLRMAEEGMDVIVLMVSERYNCESLAYISGFRGSSGAAVISAKEAFLVTDGRYALQARAQSPFQVILHDGSRLAARVEELLRNGNWAVAGFEAERLSVGLFRALEGCGAAWRDCSGFLPSLRRKKDGLEVSHIRRAGEIAWGAYEEVLGEVREGMSEMDLNALLEYSLRKRGAEGGWTGGGFIVASGERSALPHGMPTDRRFRRGDLVTVDFGATVEGYMSDLTRNFSLGPLSGRTLEMESVLLCAHRKAADLLRPGVECRAVDAAARCVIVDAGWGPNFPHGLGHGLGLEVHEAPRLSRTSEDVLMEGDVVTIEPGIYLEGWGGLRIEDDYLVTAEGGICLSGGKGQSVAVLEP